MAFIFITRMSKKIKRTPFKDYERSQDDNVYEKGYIRLVHIQLVCMNDLSNSAFRLYIMMKSYAKGDTEFEYPHRLFKNILSKQGFINARKELIDKGFIEPFISHASCRQANKYKFSGKWREYYKGVIDCCSQKRGYGNI